MMDELEVESNTYGMNGWDRSDVMRRGPARRSCCYCWLSYCWGLCFCFVVLDLKHRGRIGYR
ncbi:hypothetical protein BDW42DRAFT_181393 [Aspergillus taichungensis]|uniref:Uncharacterized protein n=1 Tax=Aspergillus taichungensis TaxID=482145 RepID=A0A2J5HDW7_9EURO|nr:hypothetical protein BDW42DRAFT_181393 [Aspergillus taichungensis]